MNDSTTALPPVWTWTRRGSRTSSPVVAVTTNHEGTWFLVAPKGSAPRWVEFDAGKLILAGA